MACDDDESRRGSRYAAIVAALARPADIRALPLTTLHTIMAMRLGALFERAGRDPIAELTQRLRSVTAAMAMLRLTEEVVRCWPDRFVVNRPCCLAMSPDERTLAAMSRAAASGDRDGFCRVLAGFVAADRHEALFAAAVEAVAALQTGARC